MRQILISSQIVALVLAFSTLWSVPTQADITYYHWDALGSPVAASDEQGNLRWREDYKPYGEKIRNEPAAATNTRAYTGHAHDNDTGLTYMQARFYDPVVGRFMAVDPIAFTEANLHSFNRYSYANNNPHTYFDPNGEEALRINLGFVGLTAGIDDASGQPFLQVRAGTVGGGAEYYRNYNFFDSNTRMVGDCKVCDARAESTGMNITAGGSLRVGPVGVDGKVFERIEKIANVEHSNGKITSYGISTNENLKARSTLGVAKPDITPRNRPYIGANVDLEANVEWGWLVPWSRINSSVQSQREPNF